MKKRIFDLVLAIFVAAGMLFNPAVFSFAANDVPTQAAPPKQAESDATATPGAKTESDANADSNAKSESDTKADKSSKAKSNSGTKEETNTDTAAIIGSQKYKTLQSAVNAAQDGQTVKLLKDVKEYVAVSKSITIDLDEHTATADGAGPICAFKINSDSSLSLKNGTITGGDNASGKDGAVTVSKGASLNADKLTFTGNMGTSILNNGTANITDCTFTGNDHEKTGGYVAHVYIIENRNKGKATITRSKFENNNRNKGGIIYSGTSGCEMTLTSCDIKNNNMGEHGAVYIWNGLVRLVNTTVTKNRSSKYTGGLDVGNGDFDWVNSAIYDNETTDDSYCSDDIYINGAMAGRLGNSMVPLPEEMSDHGNKLTGRVLMNADNSFIAEKALSDAYFPHNEWAVVVYEKEEDVCEYNGTKYGSIKEAVAAANGEEATITLLKDTKCSDSFSAGKGIVLDLNGHTLRGKFKKQSILRISGDKITIKNGKIAEAGIGGNQPAVYTTCKDVLVENVEFTDNPNCALQAYNSKPAADTSYIEVKECTFTNNLNGEGASGHALSTISYNANVIGCTFKDNRGGVRLCSTSESAATNHLMKMMDCKISGCKDAALITKISTNHKVYVNGCEFFDNSIAADAEEESICLQQATSYGKANGGEVTFEDCKIHDNKGAKHTVEGQSGTMQMKNCTIQRNTADTSGGIYAGRNSFLYLVDTVIKNNRATGNGTTISGGISLFSSVLKPAPAVYVNGILVSPQGTESNASYSGLYMQGGALYNNESSMFSPAADDLYVSKSCKISVPNASEMQDGTHDFEGLQWREDSKEQFVDKPAERVDSNRYYTVGSKTPKQVYIHNGKDENGNDINDGNAVDTDGENATALGIGNDNNDGTKKRPVRTIKRALELADEYNVSNIITLSTIGPKQLSQESADNGSGDSDKSSENNSFDGTKKAMSKMDEESNDGVRVLDIGGKTITRDIDFLGVILDIDEPTVIRNTKINGNSERASEMGGVINGQIIKATDTKLTLDEGTQLMHNDTRKTAAAKKGAKTANGKKAAGIDANNTELTINDDVLIDDMHGCYGGALHMHNNSKLTMNGGKITNSSSNYQGEGYSSIRDFDNAYGGGVLLTRGSEMIMNGGEISGNSSLHSGGGVSLGTNDMNSVNKDGGCSFTMNGGSLDGNRAYVSGGGLFVQVDCSAEINAGDITNNEAKGHTGSGNKSIVAEHAGGGIYVNGYHSKKMIPWYELKKDYGELKIKDVEIANNTAKYEGSAIAFCGVGSGSLGKLEGTAIHDNYAEGKGSNGYVGLVGKTLWNDNSDVFFDNVVFEFDHEKSTGWTSVEEAEKLPNSSSMVGEMLNGASYDWRDMDGNKVTNKQLANITKITKLKTAATATDKDMAESIAKTKVHINGNSSDRNAGGIGSNGRVAIGKTPNEPDEPKNPGKPDEPKVPEEPAVPDKPNTPDQITETTTKDKPLRPKTPREEEKKTVKKHAEQAPKVKTRAAGTGDASNMGFFAGIAGISGLILAAGTLRRKAHKK